MAEVVAAETVAKTAWNIVAPFALFIVVATIAFAGGVAWENRGPGPSFKVPVVGWKISPFGESPRALLNERIAADLAASKLAAAIKTRVDTGGAAITKTAAATSAVSQAQIKAIAQTQAQKVNVYVPKQAVAHCTVPAGYVRMRDDALSGADLSKVADPTAAVSSAPAGITLADVARNDVAVGATCRAIRQTLIDFQGWFVKEGANYGAGTSEPSVTTPVPQ